MGLGLADLLLLENLRLQGYLPDGGSIVELGAQQIDESVIAELPAFGEVFGTTVSPPSFRPGPLHVQSRLSGAPFAREMWQWLGFEYAAIDIDSSGGSVPLDLNVDDVPPAHLHKYSLVSNFGTTEHVANQLNAFKVMHDLCVLGGVMVHNLPAHQMEHGFFGYTPTFFWSLSRNNDYRVIYFDLRFSAPTPIPEDILRYISKFSIDFEERCSHIEFEHSSIHVVLQKQHDMDFVAPFEAEAAVSTSAAVLAHRYWTVFEPAALQSIAVSKEADLERRERAAYQREQRVDAREKELAQRLANRRWVRNAIARRFPFLVSLKRRWSRQHR